MNWREIEQTDIQSLDKIHTIQGGINEYYATTLTASHIQGLFDKKDSFRAFLYEDADYEVTVVTFIKPGGRLKLCTTGVGKYKDLETACEIAHKKLLEVIKEYGLSGCYAIWNEDNFKLGSDYFNMFVETAEKHGFTKSTNVKDESGRYILTMEA